MATMHPESNGTEPVDGTEAAPVDGAFKWTPASVALSVALFLVAGLLEVGGGWLVWRGVRDRAHPALFIPLGSAVLVAYGFIPTLQPTSEFGRIFAVYGGFFIVLSYVWAAVLDGFRPDLGDYVGAAIALVGVSIAWFWPR